MKKTLRIKKAIAKLLQISFIGKIIRILMNNSIKYKGLIISTKSKEISNSTISSLFFNMYESCEIRFIQKYLNRNIESIEIGSSIGVTGSMIGSISSERIILIEANRTLIPILKQNANTNINNYEIVNAVIDYSDKNEKTLFGIGKTNLSGQLSEYSISNKNIEIPITTLSKIKSQYKIDKYNLICDIEGAEVGLFTEEDSTLNCCDTIIIELHRTIYKNQEYTINDIKDIILKKGFKLIDSYIEVFCFKKD
ncbi:FkbM family methyltransferase [candidate division WOR-3 bacterium]|nr:FkbM family methyltransferase [candidate division WOR-3 bacterium]